MAHPSEVAMERPGLTPNFADRVRRLRNYRLLANSFMPLVVLALVLIVFRSVFPWLFSVLTFIWSADTLLLVLLVVPWVLVSWALASGKARCPSCDAPFAGKFHLWVPKTCQSCGYDITAPKSGATSSDHWRGP